MGVKLSGGPTQDEILAISLAKMGIRNGDIVADIGCGTGTMAIAAASQAAKVIAIDRRHEAITHTKAAIERSGCTNIEVFEGEASEMIRKIDVLDCAFVGGSGDIETVLEMLSTRVRRTIIIHAVLLQTMYRAVETLRRLGIFSDVVHVQVSRSRNLAGGLMLVPINPVYIIIGRCDACL